jgi:tetratricopeptide (TPR) repeat protein
MDNNNIEEKIRNFEEWSKEREKIKPIIDAAVDYHNKARAEARWKNYEQAAQFYREAITNYKNALSLNPKYYLQDLLDRVEHVIEEHVNNAFNLKIAGDKLKTESGIRDFVKFIDDLKYEERRHINAYDIAQAFFSIGDLYYEDRNFKEAYSFYVRVIEVDCDRPIVNRDIHLKIGEILFEEKRFKEALVSFVSVLSFDRGNREAIVRIEDCLKKLNILEHKQKFLAATPNEARKLIMEVL